MVKENYSRIRKQRPDLPIAISLDMHANVTEKMVSNCDVLTGYHTYPHIDMDATAVRSAELFFKMLRGETNQRCIGPTCRCCLMS